MINHYQVLGIPQNASPEQIKKAYRDFAKQYHPDKHENSSFFKQRFQEVQHAYDILSDPTSRSKFDSTFNKNNNNPYSNQNSEITILKDKLEKAENYNKSKDSQIAKLKYDLKVMEIKHDNEIADLSKKYESKLFDNTKKSKKLKIHLSKSLPQNKVILTLTLSIVVLIGLAFFAHSKYKISKLINLVSVHDKLHYYDTKNDYQRILQYSDSLIKTGNQIDTSDSAIYSGIRKFEYADLLNARAYAKQYLENDTGAVRDYTNSMEMHTNRNIYDYIGRSQLRLKLGDKEGAYDDINQALDVNPNEAYARITKALMLHNDSKFDEALPHYRAATRLNPQDSEYWLNMGSCYSGAGKTDSACIAWRRASDLGEKQAFDHIKEYCK